MFNKVNPRPNFPELEEQILKYWKENEIFEKQVNSRPEDDRYVFYDGPPFITGLPHYGHLLGSIAKDIIPRYHAMNGKRVERVWGWDCHGLPIENKVEKALGLKNRREIEEFGIDKFVEQCYSYTREVSAEWDWYIDRIGRWADIDRAYKTMDQDYMETVMWVFKSLHEKGLIYEGLRTSLFCTRCGTPVSNFEIAMDNSYADMEDPAVTIKFPLKNSHGFLKSINSKIDNRQSTIDLSLLAWTTTPWTLPSNRALVVDPAETYILAEVQKTDIELEQAWLVNELPKDLTKKQSSNITQAVLPDYKDPKDRDVHYARIRKQDGKFYFTVKVNVGDENETGEMLEETKEITQEEYIELAKTASEKMSKIRYCYDLDDGLTAEINVYQNDLKGLNVVEVEFPSLSKLEKFKKPEWFGKEVTDSKAISLKFIAGKKYDELKPILDDFEQPSHNYSQQLTTEKVILAKKRAKHVFENMDFKVIDEFKGEKLIGLEYEAPYDFFAPNENDWKVYSFENMVHMEEGTGIVHSAPGYGDIDTEMGRHHDLTIMFAVNDEGKYISAVKPWEGVYVKDADPLIRAELRERGLLFKDERIVHRYPFCYRCETPLIHKAQTSWFIDVQSIKDKLLKNNEKINWVPDHIKRGRFGKGLETAPDWGISRSRYWGTPMPIWEAKDESGNVIERLVIGSRDELMERNDEITKIIFVRHGDADLPAQVGSHEEIDPGLNEKGKKQADLVLEKLKDEKIDSIISSSMKRCLETVQPLAEELGLKVKIDERFGSTKRKEELYRLKKENKIENISDLGETKAKELFNDFLSEDADTVSKLNKEFKGRTIVIATHAEVISSMLHALEGEEYVRLLKKAPHKGTTYTVYLYKNKLLDLHRPVIDDLVLEGANPDLSLRRVPETLDVWMESASMPYAQVHYPFENKQKFEDNFPADYISEYIAQTRAWFYVMHVISTALMDKPSFKNVVVTGVIMGNDGRKMSKSFGNYPDPKGVLQQYGGDALRMYILTSSLLKGESVNVNEDDIRGQLKDFLLPLWNTYSYFVTYANIHDWDPENKKIKTENYLDKWIIARLHTLTRDVKILLEDYDIPGATNKLPEFLFDLSRWYIRRSRDRFKDGDEDALATLYYVLIEFCKVIAPFTPFVAEEIYRGLTSGESVHLEDYPEADLKLVEENDLLMRQMESVRIVSNLGQSIRAENGLKVRQPLSKVQVTLNREPGDKAEITDWMKEILKDELNVKEVVEIKNSEDHLSGENLISVEDQKENIKVTIDTNLSIDLKREGLYRELVRNIQAFRKKQGLKFGEMIELAISTDNEEIKIAIEQNSKDFSKDVNVSKVIFEENDGEVIVVEGNEVKVEIK